MRAHSIQVQPARTPGIVMDDIVREFQAMAEMSDLAAVADRLVRMDVARAQSDVRGRSSSSRTRVACAV
jgi:hypothetical protein